MLPADILLTFFATAVLLALAPGPDNIFVLTQASVHGARAGLAITCGLCSGLIGHTLAVAFGVAVIFQTSLLAFTLLKYLGAAYLVYLAWQALRSHSTNPVLQERPAVPLRKLYLRGIIMNLTNPKVTVFFLALLPQFTDPNHGQPAIQMLLLGGLFILATILVFATIALLAGSLGQWLNSSPKWQRMMNRVSAIVFLGLALKLATVQR